MSGYEKHIGKLKKVDLSGYNNDTEKFFEKKCREILTDKTEEDIQERYNKAVIYPYRRSIKPWEYIFFETCYFLGIENKFYCVNGNIYETIEDVEYENDYSFFKDNGDGTYDYVFEFYNGGTCLNELIEVELSKL
jgi:hypothetical protein